MRHFCTTGAKNNCWKSLKVPEHGERWRTVCLARSGDVRLHLATPDLFAGI